MQCTYTYFILNTLSFVLFSMRLQCLFILMLKAVLFSFIITLTHHTQHKKTLRFFLKNDFHNIVCKQKETQNCLKYKINHHEFIFLNVTLHPFISSM